MWQRWLLKEDQVVPINQAERQVSKLNFKVTVNNHCKQILSEP